jgi:monoamine oxidase
MLIVDQKGSDMMIKACELQVGQWVKVGSKWETVSSLSKFETGVMVFYGSQVGNPFISSTYGSYCLDTLVEVDGYPE